MLARCGNNVRENSEECDVGDVIDADGCEHDCRLPACHNGILDPGELCFLPQARFSTGLSPVSIIAAGRRRGRW